MILKWFKNRRERKRQKTLILQLVINVVREEFVIKKSGFGKSAPEEVKKAIGNQILIDVEDILISDDWIMANRQKLAENVIDMASYQVLILPSKEEGEDVTKLRGQPGISGELKAHLVEIAKINKFIKKIPINNLSHGDIFDACLFLYWTAALKVQVFNAIRIPLGDYHPEDGKDWFRPFFATTCALYESDYRREIGLPDILSEEPGWLGVKYSNFIDFVLNGARYPNLAWEEHYKS